MHIEGILGIDLFYVRIFVPVLRTIGILAKWNYIFFNYIDGNIITSGAGPE